MYTLKIQYYSHMELRSRSYEMYIFFHIGLFQHRLHKQHPSNIRGGGVEMMQGLTKLKYRVYGYYACWISLLKDYDIP